MTTQTAQSIKVLTSLRKVTSFPLLVFAILADLWLFVNTNRGNDVTFLRDVRTFMD